MTESLVLPQSKGAPAPIIVEAMGPFAFSVAGTGFYDLDPGGTAAARPTDIVIPGVKAGDTVEYGVSLHSPTAVNAQYLGVAPIVAAAPVRVIPPLGWLIPSGAAAFPAGSVMIPLTEADVENGSVRLRIQAFRIAGTAARSLGFTQPMKFWGRGPF